MMFEVGDLVVCVDDRHRTPGCRWLQEIEARRIYTVRWVGLFFHATKGEKLCVRLDGVLRPNTLMPRGIPCPDMPFNADRFRPVRKTDISELRKLVAPVPRQPVPAE